MNTEKWAITLVLFITLLISIAQVLLKAGSKTAYLDLSLFTNYALIFGLVVYAISLLLLLMALRHGELSVLYPVIATSYIWVSLLSMYFFSEVITIYKWVGIFFIILGVSLVGGGK